MSRKMFTTFLQGNEWGLDRDLNVKITNKDYLVAWPNSPALDEDNWRQLKDDLHNVRSTSSTPTRTFHEGSFSNRWIVQARNLGMVRYWLLYPYLSIPIRFKNLLLSGMVLCLCVDIIVHDLRRLRRFAHLNTFRVSIEDFAQLSKLPFSVCTARTQI